MFISNKNSPVKKVCEKPRAGITDLSPSEQAGAGTPPASAFEIIAILRLTLEQNTHGDF